MGIISSKLMKKSVAIGVIIVVILAGGALWWYSDGTKGDIGATTVIGIHIVDAVTNS